jgi:hypothetical protein
MLSDLAPKSEIACLRSFVEPFQDAGWSAYFGAYQLSSHFVVDPLDNPVFCANVGANQPVQTTPIRRAPHERTFRPIGFRGNCAGNKPRGNYHLPSAHGVRFAHPRRMDVTTAKSRS